MNNGQAVEEAIEHLKQEFGGHPYVHFAASGTAALEIALRSLALPSGSAVIVPTHCCYLVGAAVLRAGLVPLFVDVGRDLVLSVSHLTSALLSTASAVIAVHSYGFYCDIPALRKVLPNGIPIIEDASLAFGLRYQGKAVGGEGDRTVLSLGERKPLSLNGGGVILSSDDRITSCMARYGDARFCKDPPLAYPLSPYALLHLPNALRDAQGKLLKRRVHSTEIQKRLSGVPALQQFRPRDFEEPSWHRLPVWITDSCMRLDLAKNFPTLVELPHRIPTPSLPMFESLNSSRVSSEDDQELLLFKPQYFEEQHQFEPFFEATHPATWTI